MSHTANQGLNNIESGEKKSRDTFRRRMARPFFVLCWITVGIALILLGFFLFSAQRNTPMSLLSDLKTGPTVFRTKIQAVCGPKDDTKQNVAIGLSAVGGII